MTGYKILYNPGSRGGKSKKKYNKVISKLDEKNIDYVIEETLGPIKGIDQAANAKEEGFETVIAMGGDGTVHEIANGCLRGGLNFGVVPLGSGNDFANGVGLSSWKKGVDTMQDGKIVPISVLKVGDRYSVNVLDAGLGADIVKLSEKKLKWMSGQKKYTLLTLGSLVKHNAYPVTITVDGVAEDYDLNILAMGFGQTFGSGMRILPDARYDQEEMQISIVHSGSKLKVLRLFPKVFDGKHVHVKDHVTMLRGKKITIEMRGDGKEMFLEAEGEIIGTAPMEVEVVKDALPVLVPRDWEPSHLSAKVK